MDSGKKRSRRLRKKLYLDEFSILGFEVEFHFEGLDEAAFDQFVNELIDFVEARNLVLGGGGGAEQFGGLVCSSERYGSTTEEDRAVLTTWLNEKSFITDAIIGELVDPLYGYA